MPVRNEGLGWASGKHGYEKWTFWKCISNGKNGDFPLLCLFTDVYHPLMLARQQEQYETFLDDRGITIGN